MVKKSVLLSGIFCLLLFVGFAVAANFIDDSQGEFFGTYNDTFYNSSEGYIQVGNSSNSSEVTEMTGAEAGLVSYWRFNESSWSGVGGEVKDVLALSNGSGLNGATTTSGLFGNATSFDGVDDYVGISNREELNPGLEDFTITGWAKSLPRAGSTQWQIYVGKRTTVGTDGYYIGLNQDEGLNFMVGDGSNRYDTGLNGGTGYVPISYGEWVHFAAVVNRSNSRILLYVNGSLSASRTFTTLNSINNSQSLSIGRDVAQTTQDGFPVNGSVDELAFWNRSLSSSEILALYSDGVSGAQSAPTTGNYTSEVKDAGAIVNWTNVSWNGLTPGELGELPDNNGYDAGANMSGNVLLMHMDEVSGTIVDFSGEGNDGTQGGGVTYGASGKYEDALSFDGSNDYLSLANDASLNLGNVLTFEAWIYPTDLSGRYSVYSTRRNNPAGSFQLEIGTGNSHTGVVAIAGVNTWIVESENNAVTLNEWNHIVYTRSGTGTGSHKIYVNGQEKTLQTTAAYDFVDNSDVKLIGSGNGLLAMHYFPGRMDEVAIYDRVLSASEVSGHYNRTGVGSDLRVQLRTSSDNSSWSNYSDFYDSPSALNLSSSRYVQYLVSFLDVSAYLYNLTLTYDLIGDLTVSLNSPEDNYLTNSFSISANCSASSLSANLTNATLYHDFSGNWEAQDTNSVSGSSNSTSFVFSDVTVGTSVWNCYFCDVNGSCEFSSLNRTIVLDNLDPVVSLVSPVEDYYENSSQSVDFVFNVSDDIARVLDCGLFVNDSEVASNSSVVAGVVTTISNSFLDGNYSWYLNCSDGVNFGLGEVRNITVDAESDYVPFWAKSNTHTHTTNSDGDSSPAVVAGLYRGLGYNVLAITDHGYVTNCSSLTNLSDNFLCVSSEEWTSTKHVVRVGASVPYNNAAQYIQDAVNAVNADGGFAVAAHPNWSSTLWTVSELTSLENYTAMEIYNKVIERLTPSPYALGQWDQVLISGKRIFGVAADDMHRVNTDLGYGFTKVYMPAFSQSAYMDSMKAGYFYASQGPSMDEQAFELICDGSETYHMGEGANCSAVRLIANLSATSSSFVMENISLIKDGVVIDVASCSSENCSFDYSEEVALSGYYRLEAVDDGGFQVWSNPIWVTKIALPVVMNVASPENGSVISDYTPLLNVSLNQNSSIWYSLNGSSNVTLCDNCSSYSGYVLLKEGMSFIDVYANNSDNAVYSERVYVQLEMAQISHDSFDDNSSVEFSNNVFWNGDKMSMNTAFAFGNFVSKPIFTEHNITSFTVTWIENNTADARGEGQRAPIVLKYRINNSDWVSLDGLGNYIVNGTEITGLNGNNFSVMFDFEKNNETPVDLLEFNLTWTEFTHPLILNSSESTTSSSATIAWETDTASNSTLEYGDSVLLGTVLSDSDLVTSHSITIPSLNANSVYYYRFSSCTIDSCSVYPQAPYPVDSFTTQAAAVVIPPAAGGGGGGGSGGGAPGVGAAASSGYLNIGPVAVVGAVGEEKSLSASVKNNGRVAANKCTLVAEGEYIDSSEIYNIGVGEIVEFAFVLSILDANAEDLELRVVCLDNVSEVVPLDVTVFKPELDISIDEISFVSGEEFKIRYSVDSVDDSLRVLFFRIFNSVGGVVVEVPQEVELKYGEVYEGEVLVDLADVDEGMLRLAIGDKDKVSFVEEDFVYGGGVLTGFAAFEWVGDFSYIGIILVVFLILAGILVVRIFRLRKKGKK